MKERIYLSPPTIDDNEKRAIIQALDTGWIAPVGPSLDLFEEKLSDYYGGKKVLLLNSGTSALHLSLVLAGIKEGDRVITSSFTFAASVNVILYQKAIPVFIDSEDKTWNLDPEVLLEFLRKTDKQPRALILTHLYGRAANLDEIRKIANDYELILIEDAAEAMGTFYGKTPVGSLGDYGVISFNGNKLITTSGGGALICDDDKYNEGLYLATQANNGVDEYNHERMGYNYRLSNILAALGIAQFDKLEIFLDKKSQILETYREQLSDYLCFPDEKEHPSNNWLTTGLIRLNKNPRELMNWLENENIESRRLWKPLQMHKAYSNFEFYGDGTCERLFDKGICLPSGTGLSTIDQEKVISSIKAFFS